MKLNQMLSFKILFIVMLLNPALALVDNSKAAARVIDNVKLHLDAMKAIFDMKTANKI